MNQIEEYLKLLDEVSHLPDGEWYAVVANTLPELGWIDHGTLKRRGVYKSPVKAMKKAKRMAVWRDIITSGSSFGVKYWIEKKEN